MTSRPGAAAMLVLVIAALHGPAAQAHATLKQSAPADGAVLARAPTEVSITFNEALEKLFSGAVLRDRAGSLVGNAKAALDPANPAVLRLAVPPLKPGRYVVKWTAVGHDGHRQHGAIRFSVR
ncbi:copper resistance CopC family protein [Massilia sp. TWP1-3-3]|uniref:copper resistance CopC family protein n=1 Tax=Massilia sp. TWP1-3-3 TaxID=2804573 RepID=UPI003CF4CFC1